MTGLNFLFWVIGSVIALIVIGILGLIVYGLAKFNHRRSGVNYDRMENALSKRKGTSEGKGVEA